MKDATTRLTLMLPGLFEPLPNPPVLSLPKLEKALGRAERESAVGDNYVASLFSLFDHTQVPDTDLPEGAVNYAGELHALHDGCYMRADPVHLRADRDRLLLFNCAPLAITAAEAATLAQEFNQHFAEQGMRLITPHAERWYLHLEHCPELRTCALSEVNGHHIEAFMPVGREAATWRRLLNEMQMLLFQSAVNQRREAEGRLTINGIWLSGVGELPAIAPTDFHRIYGSDPSTRGMARLAGVQSEPVPEPEACPWQVDRANLMVLTDLLSPLLAGDAHAWAEGLQGVEQRVGILLDQMQGFKGCELIIYPCKDQRFILTPAGLRRFWRRGKSLPAYTQSR